MKIRLKLLFLLGLSVPALGAFSVLVFGAGNDAVVAVTRAVRRQTELERRWARKAKIAAMDAATPARSGAIGPMVGGENCATPPTVISGFPYTDSDDTTANVSDVGTVSGTCVHPDFNRVAGPDLVYQFTSDGTTSLRFTVDPQDPNYDPSVYILSTCGVGATCQAGSDFTLNDQNEVIGPVILPAGTYFLYVDSFYASEAECDPFINPGCSAGPYTLSIDDGLTTPTPSNTRTPTVTRTPTNTLTPTVQPGALPGYYTLVPCRVVDTRVDDGPPLLAGTSRVFQMVGRCGIPATATSLALNVTVTEPTAAGHITVYSQGDPLPLASTINYRAGQTRANNAVIRLGAGGAIAVFSGQSSGTTHFVIDVTGFFRSP